MFFNICITVIQRKALSYTANYQITKDLRACRDSVLPLFPSTKQLPPRYWCHLGLWQYQGFPSLQHMVIDHDNTTHGQISLIENFPTLLGTPPQSSFLQTHHFVSVEGGECLGTAASPLSTCGSCRDDPGTEQILD